LPCLLTENTLALVMRRGMINRSLEACSQSNDLRALHSGESAPVISSQFSIDLGSIFYRTMRCGNWQNYQSFQNAKHPKRPSPRIYSSAKA
jgi:hypothetical protein